MKYNTINNQRIPLTNVLHTIRFNYFIRIYPQLSEFVFEKTF